MSSSPEPRESAAAREKASPQPQLPAGLPDSSPEIDNTSRTAISSVTAVAQPTATVQPSAADQPDTVDQQPRHHDVIMEENDQFEDEIWKAMSGGSWSSRDRDRQERCTVPSSLGEPGPAESRSRSQASRPTRPTERRATEQPVTFLAPGQGRTSQQVAAAERLGAAVAARARDQQEAERERQAHLAGLTNPSVGEGADEAEGSGVQPSVSEGNRTDDWHQQQGQREGLDPDSGDSPGHARQSIMPMQLPTDPNPQMYQQPSQPAPFPVPSNTSGVQPTPNQGSQQRANNSTNMVHNHRGDSIFNQMMDDLIRNGRAENIVHQQVRLPPERPVPFGREFLYYGKRVGSPHWIFLSRARAPWSEVRTINNARDGAIVGWQDSESPLEGGVHLFITDNPGTYGAHPRGLPSRRQRR